MLELVEQVLFFLGWIFLVSLVSYFFNRIIFSNESKYKEELTKTSVLINKESNKANLIEAMGLSSQYENQETYLRKKNQRLKLFFDRIFSWGKTLPITMMIAFPFLVILAFSRTSASILILFWIINWEFSELISHYLAYGNYRSSLDRINNFLILPEKNDNLEKLKLDKEIKTITFESVNFKYKSSQRWVLQNFNKTFHAKNLNRLTGENGRGKSTILYLILGLIKPNGGQVIITDIQGQNHNLHQDINLKHWRENNVTYAAHDNLIEEGSTGQRQLANIEKLLTKKHAWIWLFDEADNALDKEKKANFQKKLEELVQTKLVIYIKHETEQKQ